jgi:hypothetical protein
MRLLSFLVGVALATAGPVLACDGQEETLGSLTRCTPTACPAGETWDSLQCACVPARDAGCPLMATECPAAEQFDPLTCRCVMPATDAGLSPHDATLPVCQRAPPGGPGPCATGYELDPETCECNPVADAGEDVREEAAMCTAPPVECATGYSFDRSVCVCVPVPDAG